MQIRVNNPKNGGISTTTLDGPVWTLGEAKEELVDQGVVLPEDKVALNGVPNADETTQLREGDTLDIFPGKPEGSVQ